jgi:hypothetical protein
MAAVRRSDGNAGWPDKLTWGARVAPRSSQMYTAYLLAHQSYPIVSCSCAIWKAITAAAVHTRFIADCKTQYHYNHKV